METIYKIYLGNINQIYLTIFLESSQNIVMKSVWNLYVLHIVNTNFNIIHEKAPEHLPTSRECC